MTSTEAEFLAAYDPSRYPPVALTVDLVLLTIRDGRLCVLLIQRANHPFRGCWALPGGFVDPGEDADTAARRELHEETGLAIDPWHIEQLRTYTAPDRDPRVRAVSVAYIAFLPKGLEPTASSDAAAARYWAIDDLESADTAPRLAFDHAQIVADAVERARAKLEYTTLATTFLPERFTLGELRRIYEAVWGVPLHASNFRRKVLASPGFVQRTRDPKLFRRGTATEISPPLRR